MKALTVRQPWATLLVMGVKRIETRTRDTKHRGPLLIHAGLAAPCRRGERLTLGEWEVENDGGGFLLRNLTRGGWHPYRLPVGALIGSVNIIYTRPTSSGEYAPDDREQPIGDHSTGRFGWYTDTRHQRFGIPIPCRGALGLWTPPADVLAQIPVEVAA